MQHVSSYIIASSFRIVPHRTASHRIASIVPLAAHLYLDRGASCCGPQAVHGELRLMDTEYELLARMNDLAAGQYSDMADLAAGLAVFMQARGDMIY